MLVQLGAAIEKFAQLSDETLVARIRAGEPALYELLMRRHNRRLFRIARAIVRDSDEAEDVMQDAYVRAFEHLASFEGRASFATWLTRIAVHEASARRRRRGRILSLESIEQDGKMTATDKTGATDPGDAAAMRELAAAVEKALDAIPETYRAVFVLREVEGLDTAETASCLEITEESAKVRLHRAKKLLRKELERRIGAATESVYDFHLSRCDRVVARVFTRLHAPR